MKCKLVVFDWAGTLIDFGCRAPVVAFLDAFAQLGVPIDEATARKPLGAHDRDHTRQILAMPDVAGRATAKYGRAPDEALVDLFHGAVAERLHEVLPRHATPIPGAIETVAWLRSRGTLAGATTGYARSMMEIVEPIARQEGLALDVTVCADDVPQGQPAPWACFRVAERLGIYPLHDAVKVGGTAAGVAEGRNAGMCAVAVDESGNEVGHTAAELVAMPPHARANLVGAAESRLRAAGAYDVLRSVAELPRWMRENGL